MSARIKATVRNWNADGGWGILSHERMRQAIHFGIDDLQQSAQSSLLRKGAEVEFILEQGVDRYVAKHVRVLRKEEFHDSTYKRAPPRRDHYPPSKRKRTNEARYNVSQAVPQSALRVKTNPESKKNSVFDLTGENNDYSNRRHVNRNNSNPSRKRRLQKKKRKLFKEGVEKSAVKVDAVDLCTPSPERPKSVSTQQRKSVSIERRRKKIVKEETVNSRQPKPSKVSQPKPSKVSTKQEKVSQPAVKSEKTGQSVKAEPTQTQKVKPEPTRAKFKLKKKSQKPPTSVKKETVAQESKKKAWRKHPKIIGLPKILEWQEFRSKSSKREDFVKESSRVKKQLAQVKNAIIKERKKPQKPMKQPRKNLNEQYPPSDSSVKPSHKVPKAIAVPTPPVKKTSTIPPSPPPPSPLKKKKAAKPPPAKQVKPEIEKGKSVTPQPPARPAKPISKQRNTTAESGNPVKAFLKTLQTGDLIQFTWTKEGKPYRRHLQCLMFYDDRGLVYLEKRVEGDSVETLPLEDFQYVTDLSKSSAEPAPIEIKQPSPSPKKRPTPPPKVKPRERTQKAQKADRFQPHIFAPDKKRDWKEALNHPKSPPASPPGETLIRPFNWLVASDPETPTTARKPGKVNKATSWKDVSLSSLSSGDDDLSDEEFESQRPSRKIVNSVNQKRRVTSKVPNFNQRAKNRKVPPPPPPRDLNAVGKPVAPPGPTWNYSTSRKRPVQTLQELFDPHQKKKRKVKRLEPVQKVDPAEKLIDDYKSRCSAYKGVDYLPNSQMWRGVFEVGGRVEHLGTFYSEKEAAKAVNERCKKHGMQPLNPTLCRTHSPKPQNNIVEPGKSVLYKIDGFSFLPDDFDPDSFTDSSSKEEYQETSSRRTTKQKKKYIGVHWHATREKWQVKRNFKGFAHYGGFWETEELAAHAADDMLITFSSRVQDRWINFPRNKIELAKKNVSSIYTELRGNQAILRQEANEILRRRVERIHA